MMIISIYIEIETGCAQSDTARFIRMMKWGWVNGGVKGGDFKHAYVLMLRWCVRPKGAPPPSMFICLWRNHPSNLFL